MLQVKPVGRGEIDDWTIAKSGLPVRVVNSARSEGIRTIGELRGWKDSELLRLRSLGRISLGHIRSFFALCDEISAGRKSIAEFQEIFQLFLDADESNVLILRYGFHAESPTGHEVGVAASSKAAPVKVGSYPLNQVRIRLQRSASAL